MKENRKKVRRTNYAIEKDILNATRQLVEEKGFANLTLTGIAKKAGIEPSVFYNRYEDLNQLIDKFTRTYDYWFNDLIPYFDELNDEDYPQYFEKLFTSLVQSLYKNKSMQQLLIWELSEDNEITRRTAGSREVNTGHIAEITEKYFKNNNVNINIRVLSGLLIGGIYYLILHRERSTFTGIDYNTRKGKNLLLETTRNICLNVFAMNSSSQETYQIAKRLKEKGVDVQIISESTGLALEKIHEL